MKWLLFCVKMIARFLLRPLWVWCTTDSTYRPFDLTDRVVRVRNTVGAMSMHLEDEEILESLRETCGDCDESSYKLMVRMKRKPEALEFRRKYMRW